ncbi:MAG TPA: DEAD/DEAH box helicase family protein [Candidatus Sulfotelmatobacter sp.]|nr:DEAD/DEAH box helicase family protein [Candidatus Sulfotelmatobacter sp.]
MNHFLTDTLYSKGPWQSFERAVARLMKHGNFLDVRVVGRSGDGGADIIGHNEFGKRLVVQVKFKERGNGSVGLDTLKKTLDALKLYRGDIAVIATNGIITEDLRHKQRELAKENIYVQFWDWPSLLDRAEKLPEFSNNRMKPHKYQEEPIQNIVDKVNSTYKSGLVVMATGLGKTFVAAESANRLLNQNDKIKRVLVLAHTNELIYQLERSFWPVMKKSQISAILNGNEKGDIENAEFVFACIPSVISEIDNGTFPVNFDLIIIDEAHHSGSYTYKRIVNYLNSGKPGGPFLLGLTATPWRSDEVDLDEVFGSTIVKIDIIEGMKKGYLTNVDYRMYFGKIDWDELASRKGEWISPKKLNKTLFISEFSNESANIIKQTWLSLPKPRGIIFCSTIEHAMLMKSLIQSLEICRVEAIYSGTYKGKHLSFIDRSILMSDFADGKIGIMCAVDIFNEGIDVPDVNLVVFQRVTHSRRIFVQQLGRGLRISPEKEKVVVLDFVSDIRRVAAAVEINRGVSDSPQYINIGKPVKFFTPSGENNKLSNFLDEWLKDVATIQDAENDENVLKFPPEEIIKELS